MQIIKIVMGSIATLLGGVIAGMGMMILALWIVIEVVKVQPYSAGVDISAWLAMICLIAGGVVGGLVIQTKLLPQSWRL